MNMDAKTVNKILAHQIKKKKIKQMALADGLQLPL